MRVAPHRRSALLVLVVVVVATFSAPVFAHAYLGESAPENGEQVGELPEEVVLTFTGDGVQVAEIEVTDGDGEDVSGEAEIDPDDTQVVSAPIEDSEAGEGIYTVQWEVLADDGHTTSGSFFFSVGDEEPDREHILDLHVDEGEDDELATGEIPAKGGLLLALVALVGMPITLLGAVYPVSERFRVSREKHDRRVNTALFAAAGLFFLSALALGLTQAAGATGLSVSGIIAYTGLDLGRAWLFQLVIGAALLSTLWVGRQGRISTKGWLCGAAVGGVAALFAVSATSHSASFEGVSGIVIHMGHLVGGSLWVGGLAVLAVFVPSLLRGHAESRTAAAAIVRRFSVIATAGVVLAVASGFVLTAWHVPDLAALSGTIYGQTLSIKIALVFGALGLGGLNRFVLHRQLRGEPGRLRAVLPDGGERSFGPRATSDHKSDGSERERSERDPRRTEERSDGGERSEATRSTSGVPSDGGERTTDSRTSEDERSERDPLKNFTRSVRLEVALLVLVILVSGVVTAAPTSSMAAGDEAEWVTLTEGDEPEVELALLPSEEGPNVLDVTITDSDGPVSPEDDEVTLLMREEGGSALPQMELEERGGGTYSTVGSFANEGTWELRVDFWHDDEFVTETFEVEVGDPDDEDEDDADEGQGGHDHGGDGEPSLFANALVIGALWTGLLGIAAMSYEIARVREES